jgi:predicted enzyme related to lactoylglutathione lyase
MFKNLRSIIYHVNNIQKAKEWYTKITGVTPYFDEAYYTGFNIYGCELGVDPDLDNVNKGEHSVAYWSVDDIKQSVKTLTDNGAKIIHEINGVGDGISVAVVEDPFGNHIGLIEEKIITS